MEVNQDLIIPEVAVLEDLESHTEVEIQEMIEGAVEKDSMTEVAEIATVDAVNGNSCKT